MSRKDELRSLPQEDVSKYNYEEEQMALSWLQTVVGEGDIFNEGMNGMKMIGDTLRDGIYLCKLLRKLKPRLTIDINEDRKELSCKKNIETFLQGCRENGLNHEELFETKDLYDGTKLYLVVKTLILMKKTFSLPTEEEKTENQDSKSHPVVDKSFRFSNLNLNDIPQY